MRAAPHEHPEELEELVARLYRQVEERYAVLAELSAREAQYLSARDAVTTWTDRLRLVRRTKLRSLLIELDEVLKVFPPELELARVTQESERTPIPLGDGSQERRQWDELVAGTCSLPQSAVAALVTVGSKVPGLARGNSSDGTPPG